VAGSAPNLIRLAVPATTIPETLAEPPQAVPPDDVAPPRPALTAGQRRALIAIVAVGAALRLAWLAYAKAEPPVSIASGDQWSYYYFGNEIAAGRGYVSYTTGEATAYYPIGYPALLAGVFWFALHTPVTDDLMLVAGVLHVVLSTATIALTFVIGRRLLGPVAGLVAAALMAVFPNLVYQVTSLQLETTFLFLTTAALAILVDHDWASGPPSRNRLLAFGAVLAASALVRPFSLPLLLGLLLALVAVRVGWRRVCLALAVPVGVVVVAFIPWTIRNAVVMDAFIPSSTNMGDTLCIDRNRDAYGGFRWADHDGCVDPNLPEVERNTGNTRKAITWVLENPRRELLQIARRAKYMFREDHDGIVAVETLGTGRFLPDSTRDLLSRVADGFFFAVGGLAVVGIPILFRRAPRSERRLFFVTFGALLVIPLLLWGNPRFHVPLTTFLAVSAAGCVVFVAERVQRMLGTRQPSAWASAQTTRSPNGSANPTSAANSTCEPSGRSVGSSM
jgi:hypothetical protein